MKKIVLLIVSAVIGATAWAQCLGGSASVMLHRGTPQAGEGGFSVSATTRVKFSPGNLRYADCPPDPTNPTNSGYFYFATNQWDYQANTFCNCAAEHDPNTDLFCYGTSGYTDGIVTANVPTLCWNDTHMGNMYRGNLNGTPFDWGVYNAIKQTQDSETTYPAGTWRTLTADEWNYLLNTRTNAANLRSAAKVNDKDGLILLPDNWLIPEGMAFTAGLSMNNRGDQNTYAGEAWTAMENAGAIFLPAAGCIAKLDNGETDNLHTGYCYYITATQDNDNNKMMRIEFGADDTAPRIVPEKKNARSSVRLVQNY